MGRRGWTIVVAIVVVAGGLVGWRTLRPPKAQAAYRTDTVQRGDVRVQVSATGTLQAVTTVLVGSQVSGTISALYADFNDRVRQGQVLAQLDPTFLKAQVAQNRADLIQNDVAVNQAERDSARVWPLQDGNLVSQAEIDAARTALDRARAARAGARAALERAETNLRYATIHSPIDGVVVSRDVDVGQTVAASLSAPTLYTIANDLTRMQLEVAVDEADIGMVKQGQGATFTVDAYPNESFRGEVHQIRLAPETIQNVVTYTVVILVDNPDLKLLPGMTANVSILVDEALGVLKVPAMALRFRPAGAAAGVPRGGPAGVAGPGAAGGGQRRGMGGGGGPGGGMGGAGGMGGRQAVEGHGGPAAEGPAQRGVIWVLPDGGEPRSLRVRTGLTDGTFTQVVGDSLAEGMSVVIGIAGGSAGTPANQGTVNPFAPRPPSGGRR